MYLRRIKIENFQSFAEADIRFLPGLNVIVGPNSYGKTAILRAIRWAARDAFRGTFFVRRHAKHGEVGLLTDAWTIRRVDRTLTPDGVTKSLRENSYTVKTRNGDDLYFTKFSTVPEEVADAVGFSAPVQIGDGRNDVIDLNFADQHRDTIFLLNRPGSVAARLISAVVGVDPVLAAMKAVSAHVRAEMQTVKAKEEELREVTTAVNAFPAVQYQQTFSELDSKVRAVQELGRAYKALEQIEKTLLSIAEQGTRAVARKKRLSAAVALPWGPAQRALGAVAKLTEVQAAITRIDQRMQAPAAVIRWAEPVTDAITALVSASAWISPAQDLLRVPARLSEVMAQQSKLTEELAVAERDYKQALVEMGVCPMCGQTIKRVP